MPSHSRFLSLSVLCVMMSSVYSPFARENRKFKRHFIALPSGEQPRKTPLGPFSVTRRRPLLARSAGGSPGTPRRPTTAPRSKVSHGNARSGQADQDALGWRLRDFLVRGLRNGRLPESWGRGTISNGISQREGAKYTAATRTSPMGPC